MTTDDLVTTDAPDHQIMTDVDLEDGHQRKNETNNNSEEAVVVSTDSQEEKKKSISPLISKIIIGLCLIGIIVFVIIDSLTTGYVTSAVRDFLDWVENNPIAGIFLFIIAYFIATVFFIPGSLLTLGSGAVFASAFGLGPGVALGTMVVFFGASTGALAAFLLGRYLLREQVGRLSDKYPVFQALDQALIGNGLKIFILIRLSPIVPFNVVNYLGGVSAVSFRDYALALFGILPGTLLYVFLGASAGSLADNMADSSQSPKVTISVVVVGVVLGFAAVYLTTRYARKELNRILEERNQEEASTDVGSPESSADVGSPEASADVGSPESSADVESPEQPSKPQE